MGKENKPKKPNLQPTAAKMRKKMGIPVIRVGEPITAAAVNKVIRAIGRERDRAAIGRLPLDRLAHIGERFHRDIRLVAQFLDRLVDGSRGSTCSTLFRRLRHAARIFCGRAGHIQQHDHGVGMQFP